jgi:hypothetical protein
VKYKVGSKGNEVHIEVTETRGKQEKLLEAFQECQEGRCRCPTQEYSKLDSLEIQSDEDTIRMKLKSRPNAKFDESEIGRCLEYTKQQMESEG